MNPKTNLTLLERLTEMEAKHSKAINALEFIAFNNNPCWKDADRRKRAAETLVEIGEFEKVDP